MVPSTDSPGLTLHLEQHAVVLMPQRAVFLPELQTVFIADTHFGKEATFRNAAIPVPDQTQEQLKRLDDVLSLTRARRLVVLGDLQHSRRGRCLSTRTLIADWRLRHENLEIRLIRGNHDVGTGDPPSEWRISTDTPPVVDGGLKMVHDPDDVWLQSENEPKETTALALAGHLHPAVRLSGRGKDTLRLSCFLLRRGALILPAFSSFVDSRVIAAEPHDQIYAVAEDVVVPVRI